MAYVGGQLRRSSIQKHEAIQKQKATQMRWRVPWHTLHCPRLNQPLKDAQVASRQERLRQTSPLKTSKDEPKSKHRAPPLPPTRRPAKAEGGIPRPLNPVFLSQRTFSATTVWLGPHPSTLPRLPVLSPLWSSGSTTQALSQLPPGDATSSSCPPVLGTVAASWSC